MACDNYENGIGDNIALVRHVTGCGFAEAVHQLTGGYAVERVKLPEPRQSFPTLPPETAADREQGARYLAGRGITLGTIAEAVKAAFLRFVGGGVVFTGLDDSGRVRAATKRSTNPGDEVQRRDFKGTDKRYAPVLPGNPDSVWIVEGGVDALALRDLAKMRGQQPPTVIVSGGVGVRSFLETERIRKLLKKAKRITVAREREKDHKTQLEADASRDKLLRELEQLTGKKPDQWTPPERVKDLAEHYKNEQARAEAAPAQKLDNVRAPTPKGPGMG